MGVRHLESILRISEAHARMHLRQYVRDDDVDMAVKIIVDSFIGSQKHSVARSLSQVRQKRIARSPRSAHSKCRAEFQEVCHVQEGQQ